MLSVFLLQIYYFLGQIIKKCQHLALFSLVNLAYSKYMPNFVVQNQVLTIKHYNYATDY